MLRPAQVVITASLSLIVSLYQQLPMPLLQLHNEAVFFYHWRDSEGRAVSGRADVIITGDTSELPAAI